MEIRAAEEGEAEMLVDEFWLPLAGEMSEINSYHELVEDARSKALERKKKELNEGNIEFLVAEEDGKNVAYLKLSVGKDSEIFSRGRSVHINELYVKKEYRRQGIASELIREAESRAEEREVERIELMVDEDNLKALDLYEGEGYSSFRRFMKKEL